MRNVSTEAKKRMLRLETYAKFPFLIEVSLEDGTVYRYANSFDDVVFNDEGTEKVFESACFSIALPEEKSSGMGDGTLSISAVDSFWVNIIRRHKKRAGLRFVAAISWKESGDVIESVEPLDDMDFTLSNANWDGVNISWTMTFDENMAINIPPDIATSQKCPGVC